MKTMKIAVVHPTLMWYRIPLFKILAKFYSDIHFLITRPALLSEYACGHETNVRVPKETKVKLHKAYRVFPPPYPQAFVPGVIFELIRGRYDVVVWGENIVCIESWISFVLLKLLKRSFAVWLDEWGWPKPLLRKVIAPITNFIIRHSDACIAHGTKHRGYFSSLGVAPNRIFVTGSISLVNVENECLRKVEQLRKNLKIGNKKVVLYVGGLLKRKGVHYLIKAFHELKRVRDDVFLLIIGEGYYRKNLENLCRKLRIAGDVCFAGWISHKNLAAYYLLCDVFVLPSTLTLEGRYVGAEPWGLVLNEAMSAGKPVIATDAVGAAYDLIKNGVNGFLIKQKDVLALCGALMRVVSDPTLAREMGLKSKEIIKSKFTYERMAEGFKKAIEYAYDRKEARRNFNNL